MRLFTTITIIALFKSFFFAQTNSAIYNTQSAEDLITKGFEKYSSGDIDSCLIFFNIALTLAEDNQDWKNTILARINISSVYQISGRFKSAENLLEETEELLREYISPKEEMYQAFYNNLGTFYVKKEDSDQALKYFGKVLAIDSLAIKVEVNSLRSIAIIYQKMGDYSNAIKFINQAFNLISTSKKVDTSITNKLIPQIYTTKGYIFRDMNLIDSSAHFFRESVLFMKRVSYKDNLHLKKNMAESLLRLTELSIKKNDNTSAKKYIDDLRTIYNGEYEYRLLEYYAYSAELEAMLKNNSNAEQLYKKAIIAAEKEYIYFKGHPIKAKPYELYTKFLCENKKWEEASLMLEKALEKASISSSDINPETFNINTILDARQGIRLFQSKVSILDGIYIKTDSIKYLKEISITYQNISDLTLTLRTNVQSQASELTWSQRLTKTYQSAVKNAVTLYQKTTDKKYLEQAFYYSECNKAATLAEKVSYEKTLKSILPEEKWEILQDLRIDIAFYQKQINSARQKTKQDSTKIAKWTQIIEDLENEYEVSEKEIKDNYPEYAAAVKTFKPSTVEDIRNGFLKDNTALVEYFSTEDSWYIFTLTKDDLTVEEVKREESFDVAFDGLIKQISQQPNSSTYVQGLTDFANDSHTLYQFLLKNSLQDLPKEINSLMIIPDGKLTYFPFELLLSKKLNQDASMTYSSSVMPYLFNDYNISYGFSATVVNLTHKNTKQKKSGEPAIFAPSFSNEYIAENRSCQEDNLSYLQCNATEGERINNLVSGEIFLGDLASIKQFREVAANAPILHLATHACVDEENADGNKIFFADTYLTNEDLNTLGVNADLVVLSACDTGLGKLIKGEGLMSLSRGFLCAGAASTVMSLWSVDDCATSDLMVNFYQELKNGNDKATALKNAKLSYLAQADKLHQHPYFWAPFVLSGNVDSINSISTSSSFLYLTSGMVILLLLLFFWYRKMKN